MATLKDIGTELGLSVATVSRALNGFPEVNARTRTRVQQAADRLGYRPNRVAQRLVTGRSGMVGMIVQIQSDMSSDTIFFEMLTGLTAALATRDTDLVFAVDQSDDPVAPYQKMFERGILDGFIVTAPVPDDPRAVWLHDHNIPFVMHGQDAAEVAYPFYGIDNHAVTTDSVNLLAALGHRRIAFLNGDLKLAFANDRLAGFQDAADGAGLTIPADFIASDHPSESYGYARALAMLSGRAGAPPTAMICGSTVIAAGVLQAARDLSLNVPGDLSVMAHDDAMPKLRAINFTPALTVTRVPMREACAPLANHLVDHINGVAASRLQTLIRADVIVRNSTGPVPEKGKDPWH